MPYVFKLVSGEKIANLPPHVQETLEKGAHLLKGVAAYETTIQTCAIYDDAKQLRAYLLHWGWDFSDDWVRGVHLISAKSDGNFLGLSLAVKCWLFEQGYTVLRWPLAWPLATKFERFAERIGATLRWLETDDEGHIEMAIYQLERNHKSQSFRTSKGLKVTPTQWQHLPQIAQWLMTPEIYDSLRFDEAAPESITDVESFLTSLYTPGANPNARVYSFSIFSGRELIGFAIDYAWEYSNDTVRELDIFLEEKKLHSPHIALDTIAALIDQAFHRGALQVLGNLRSGANEKGFPRYFSLLGGQEISAQLARYGQAETGRKYYATCPEDFYVSRAGRRYKSISASCA